MYWKQKYWIFLFWTNPIWKNEETKLIIDLIQFNDYSFSDITISNIPDSYDWNTFDLSTYQLSTHGQWLSNRLIKDKTLTIKWRIIAENQWDLEEKIKRIKANILQWEGKLYLKRSNWILQTKAIVSNLSIPRENRTINWIEITITFKILDPFFYSTNINELAFYDVNWIFNTSLRYTNGSHEAKPSVFIAFKQAEDVNQIVLNINGKILQINERIKEWDSISINSEKLDIAKNWKYWIDYIWEFGEIKAWENTIWIEINGTFNSEIFIKYRDTYV